jgi:hypothetical protein
VKHQKPGTLESKALQLSKLRKQHSKPSNGEHQIQTSAASPTSDSFEAALLNSRKDFETNGKRDMEVALEESLQDYERTVEDQERQVMQTTNVQFEEEQMMQMIIKESIKHFLFG